MAEIVLLPLADRAVGEEDEGALPGEALHRMVGVDPGVHAFGRGQFGAGRPQFSRERPARRNEELRSDPSNPLLYRP